LRRGGDRLVSLSRRTDIATYRLNLLRG